MHTDHPKSLTTPQAQQDGLRINLFLARAGLCSRRKADELIAAQKVRLNGNIAAPGDKVTPKDEVSLDGKNPLARPGHTGVRRRFR